MTARSVPVRVAIWYEMRQRIQVVVYDDGEPAQPNLAVGIRPVLHRFDAGLSAARSSGATFFPN